MSRLEELIEELYPNGVEYRKLGDCAQILIGEFVRKDKQSDNGIYPVYNGGVSNTGYYDECNRPANRIIVSARGANAGFVNRVLKPFWSGNSCYTIELFGEDVDWNFLYYYLKSKEKKLTDNQQKGGIPAVSKKQLIEFKIPILPLDVQREIVRIMDNFTELTTKLTAELTARQQQYEYYRDELLDSDIIKGFPRVKLKNIATNIFRGSGIKRDDITEEGISCVRYGEIYTTYNTYFDECVSHTKLEYISTPKWFEHGDILFAITGENVEDIAKSVAYVGDKKCLAGGDIVVMKHNQNPKYLAYALSTMDARRQKGKGKIKSKVVHSNVPSIEEIEIPLPSMEMQNRIVQILDNFDIICNDLSAGLPAEIEARQKQYEYYRDKLLTFKEKTA